MHSLFNEKNPRFKSSLYFPEMRYLIRSYAEQLKDIKAYYRRYPKWVDARSILGNLLFHIPRRWDLDDFRYVRFVEDMSRGVSRAYHLVDSTHQGRVYESGVTLGEQTNEIVLSTTEAFDFSDARKTWREWVPYHYLYHTRIDLGMPIPNNRLPGRGWGVATLNIPMLALQYRYWLRHHDMKSEQKESVYRFIGSYVLPNTLDRYLDIPFFNRLSRRAQGLNTPTYPTPHPFYLTDYSNRVDSVCDKIIDTNLHRGIDIEHVMFTTYPLVAPKLYDVMRLPKEPVSRQNEWALQLARLPYVKYAVVAALADERWDRQQTNHVYSALVDASYDRIFSGVGSPEVVKLYRESLHSLMRLLEEKGAGWA